MVDVPHAQALEPILVAERRGHVVDERVGDRDGGTAAAGGTGPAHPEGNLGVEHGDPVHVHAHVLLEVERGHVGDEPVPEAPGDDVSQHEPASLGGRVRFGIDGVLPRRGAGAEIRSDRPATAGARSSCAPP